MKESDKFLTRLLVIIGILIILTFGFLLCS